MASQIDTYAVSKYTYVQYRRLHREHRRQPISWKRELGNTTEQNTFHMLHYNNM
jgi:hypothetical protein